MDCEGGTFDFGVEALHDFAAELHIDLVGDGTASPDEVPDVALAHQVFRTLDQSEAHQSAPVIVLVRHFPDADNRCALGNGAEVQHLEELHVKLVPYAVAYLLPEVVKLAAVACPHHVAV